MKIWTPGLLCEHRYPKYGCKSQIWSKELNRKLGCILETMHHRAKTDNKYDPLSYLVSIHTPNIAKKAEHEVGSTKQEVRSYLGNSASYRKMDENLGPLGYIHTLHPIWVLTSRSIFPYSVFGVDLFIRLSGLVG